MSNLLIGLAYSLGLTLAAELMTAALLRVRGWDLVLIGLINCLTNPVINLIYAWTLMTFSRHSAVPYVVLAALETAVLNNYDVIPMSEGRTFQLWGDQVCCALEEYVFGLGFGGVKYLTYNYSDREWADHVAACGGVIDYS